MKSAVNLERCVWQCDVASIYVRINRHGRQVGSIETHSQQILTSYFKPSPLKCWPINRTMSWSTLDIGLVGVGFSVSPFIVPLAAAEHAPFCWEVVGLCLASPLCCGQPLVCMVPADSRCFLRGGGETPPSSDSDDEARLASGLLWFVFPKSYKSTAKF